MEKAQRHPGIKKSLPGMPGRDRGRQGQRTFLRFLGRKPILRRFIPDAENLLIARLLERLGGGTRIRTGDEGFAVLLIG